MQEVKRYSTTEIMEIAEERLAPLRVEPIFEDYDTKMGFRIWEVMSDRRARFIPMELDMLEQHSQVGQVLGGIRSCLVSMGYHLSEEA